MAGEPVVTLVGNLTADPELRFTPSGAQVANFTVASTPRTYDRQSNDWKDGEPLFMRCAIWRDAAENVAESLSRGTRVIVQGRLRQRSYETKEGERRTVVEMDVDEIGPSLRYATTQVAKAGRRDGGQPQGGYDNQGQQPQQQQQQPPQQQPQRSTGVQQSDPWSTGPAQTQPAAAGGQDGGWAGSFSEEPPF